MFDVYFFKIIPDIISGIIVAAIVGLSTYIIKKNKTFWFKTVFSKKVINNPKKLKNLINKGQDCLRSNEIQFKRDFVTSYYSILGEWPKNLSANDKALLSNFITPNKNTHYYNGLDDSIKLMIATLNGYNSKLKNQ